MFTIRPIQEEALRPDLANLDRVRYPVIRQELAGTRATEVHEAIIGGMIAAGAGSGGVNPASLPPPLVQTALSCQACALLNGIQAVAGRIALGELPSRIEELRDRAIGSSGAVSLDEASFADSEGERFSMDAVAQVLMKDGHIKIDTFGTGPIDTARKLFTPGSFLGVSDDTRWHAYAIVGIANPNRENFALKIDSLGGRQTPISADQFLALLAGKGNGDFYAIYHARQAASS